MYDPWPHQIRGVDGVLSALLAGETRLCLTSPTGGGKSRCVCDIITAVVSMGWEAVLYTNRRLLIDQLTGVLTAAGIGHGVRAAGHEANLSLPVQISSLPTERSRTIKRGLWQPHGRDGKCLAVIDEAHLNANPTAQQMIDYHLSRGGAVLGVTATPINLGHLYSRLIVAGTNSELRKCGALVPCYHYGPDEPDLRHVGRVALGEDLTEAQNRKAIMVPGIFARVLEWWRRLNPDARPTILFAPGVPESLWFAEQFHAEGVSVAHIAGDELWVNGSFRPSNPASRAEVLEASRTGEITVLCNRFVLREGLDLKWMAHGIFATVFGSLQSYIQSGGRLLRACPEAGKTHAVIQDHGGSWHRHGSLNADREWDMSLTGPVIAGLREERLRTRQEREPALCPQCRMVLAGYRCPCGFEITPGRKSRPVIQADGSLREMRGDVYKPRRVCQKPNAADLWKRMYHRAKSKKWDATFRQAEAMFAQENGWQWPSRDLPLMPVDPLDWFKKVSEVPPERLTR